MITIKIQYDGKLVVTTAPTLIEAQTRRKRSRTNGKTSIYERKKRFYDHF